MYFHVVSEWKIFSHVVYYSCIHVWACSDSLLWLTPDDLVVYFFEFGKKITLLIS